MSALLQVPAGFQSATGQSEVKVAGACIADALRDFVTTYPDLEDRLFKDAALRPYVRVFLNEEEITYLQGTSTPVRDGDCIAIVPTVGESS